ncbi:MULTISPECIES: hypothetical protein [Allobacillus]|uniref:Uncharacterized protein n=1 Tax=Allobacillus salarius TaxID=1955272 RepID=A0A556PNV3_9BACI|nr:hypothetical protein [Allobacillus salarius]TSJ66048.1 hypothetical protein FPQ13_05655 [Allobacillus salarius]
MTEDHFNRFLTIGITLFVIGFILLFFSTSIGISMADNWVMNQGGADPAMFQIRIESYINIFVVSGSILFGIGLLTLILTYFIKVLFSKE